MINLNRYILVCHSCHTRKAGKNIKSNSPLTVWVSCNISDFERGQHNFLISLAIMLPLTTPGGYFVCGSNTLCRDYSYLASSEMKACLLHTHKNQKTYPDRSCSVQDSYTGRTQYRCPVIRSRTWGFSHLVRS
jgi:hypothetical protein